MNSCRFTALRKRVKFSFKKGTDPLLGTQRAAKKYHISLSSRPLRPSTGTTVRARSSTGRKDRAAPAPSDFFRLYIPDTQFIVLHAPTDRRGRCCARTRPFLSLPFPSMLQCSLRWDIACLWYAGLLNNTCDRYCCIRQVFRPFFTL